MRRILSFLLIPGLLCAPAAHASGEAVIRKAPSRSTLEGVAIPDRIDIMGRPLLLYGMALRKKAVFKVYVAGLYLPEKSSNAEAILGADTPRCMVMQFLRNVSAGKLCDSWNEDLEANTPDASPGVRSEFGTCAWMEDRQEGDQPPSPTCPRGTCRVRESQGRLGRISRRALSLPDGPPVGSVQARPVGGRPGRGDSSARRESAGHGRGCSSVIRIRHRHVQPEGT
jgi:hypothetical protein